MQAYLSNTRNTRQYTKYDYYLVILLSSLALGGFGGALQIPRVLAIVLFPSMLVKIRECKYYIQGYVIFFLIFILYSFISLLWSLDRGEGIVVLLYNVVHSLYFMEILVFSRFSVNAKHSLATGWMIAVFMTLIIAVWEITTDNHLYSLIKHEGDMIMNINGIAVPRKFAAVTFYNYNEYVTFLCFAMPFLLYGLLDNTFKGVKKYIVPVVIIVLSIVSVLYNGSRGGLVSMCLMLLIFLLLQPKNKYTISIVLFVIVAVGYAIYYFRSTILTTILIRSSGGSLLDGSTRFPIWLEMFKVFLSTYGLGTGAGGLESAMRLVSFSITAPHNIFLEVLVQFGILIFIFFTVFILRMFINALREHDYKIKIVLYSSILALPFYGIINSGYLTAPFVYAAFASLVVFANYAKIKCMYIKR